MFAIVQTGAKQYRVQAESVIAVEKIAGAAGDKVQLDVVMASDGEGLRSAQGKHIEAEIIKQDKAAKIFLLKKNRRKHYRRRGGHRQQRTWLRIISTDLG